MINYIVVLLLIEAPQLFIYINYIINKHKHRGCEKMRKKPFKNHREYTPLSSQQKCHMNSMQNDNNLQEDISKIYSSFLKVQEDKGQEQKQEHGYYITLQMHGGGYRHDRHDKQKNRKISEILATNQLLSIGGTDKLQQNKCSIERSKSRSRSRSGNHSRSFKNLAKGSASAGGHENRGNIIHGVYNRSHLSSQHSVKENHKTLEERESANRNARNISNFERLKLEAEKLEKSNVVLGIKQENNLHQRKSSAKQLSIKQCLTSHKNHNANYTKTQRYRYKQNLTNRFKNTEKGASMHNTLTDMKSYYHHITAQIHNRSTHKLSTEGDREISLGTENRQAEDIVEFEGGRVEPLRKGSMNNHYKSASEWNINKKYSKESKTNYQPTTNFLQPSHNISTHTQTQAQIHTSSDQYLINNEFIPMINRSVLDKNRQNIKKISKNVNRILSSKYGKSKNEAGNRCSTTGDQTNENIDQFIRTKMSILDLTTNYDNNFKNSNRNPVGLQSAHNKSLRTCNRSQYEDAKKNNEMLIEDTQYLKQETTIRNQSSSKNNKNGKKINSQSDLLKKTPKIDTTNAAKFYRPQLEKFKGKAGLMIVDPHLKAKAIQISTKELKKNNDIVIICL